MLEQGESYASKHEHLHERVNRHPSLVVALDMPREQLYARIDTRVDTMVRAGLVEEVRGLVKRGMGESLTSRQAIGYKEVIEYLEGSCSLDDAAMRSASSPGYAPTSACTGWTPQGRR